MVCASNIDNGTDIMRLSIRTKLFFSHYLAIIMVSGSIGSYFYQSSLDNLMKSLQSRLKNSAAIISRDFLVKELDQIQVKNDMATKLYKKYSRRVRDMVATNPDIAFIYIMRKDEDRVHFVIDSDPVPAPPGEIYKSVVKELLEGFIRPSVDKEIYSDKWGHFLSGYSPLPNGEGRYLIGIDMRADEVKQKFLHIRMVGLFSLLLSLLLAAIFAFLLSRHFTNKINLLINRCSEIADENLRDTIQPILPITDDELDLLNKAFERMAHNLEASRRQKQEAHVQLLDVKNQLELRVRERTIELETSNQDLKAEIRRREKMEQILESTARTDYLTSLLNRRAMMQRLEQEVSRFKRQNQPFSIVMIDLDYFKAINDTYGHPAGDQLLIQISDLLRLGVRDTDEIARWGGEEFMILFPDTDFDMAVELAHRLNKCVVKKEFKIEGNSVKITASFGVALYSGQQHLQNLLKEVDDCLYEAKERGRNVVVTTRELFPT